MKSPCWMCEDRTPGCHDRCDKYQAYAKENKLIREYIKSAKQKENELNDMAIKAVERSKRK